MTETRTTSATGGQKGSKDERYDLIPVEPLRQLATLYGRGAQKYADHNWMRGYEWHLSYAAAQRHLNQFWGGEDLDEEMQLPHVISAAFHCLALAQFMIDHPGYDTRTRRPATGQQGEQVNHLTRLLDQIEPPAEGDWQLDPTEAGDDE